MQKTNNPDDLGKDSATGGGVQGSAGQVPFTPGPVIPNPDMMSQIGEAAVSASGVWMDVIVELYFCRRARS
jgi:hypothetical protein